MKERIINMRRKNKRINIVMVAMGVEMKQRRGQRYFGVSKPNWVLQYPYRDEMICNTEKGKREGELARSI
ncbi:MAG: hypothetical protein N3G78_01900 [Desulfobacterota bacterium]|nr:hypothetical protein [Thermodesulfobacteriota bacterium]